MSASIVKVIKKAGTTYSVDNGGATDIELHYQVQLSEPLGTDELITSFSDGTTTIPAIGTEHPARAGYYVSKYKIKQPDGPAKHTLDVDVIYTAEGWSEEQVGEETIETNVEQWGWSDGTTERELNTATNGDNVVNSAGYPFDSAPQVSSPAPTFSKVVRYGARQAGWNDYVCTVNAQAVTIGGISFAPRTLLCTIAEQRVIGDEIWPYRYTINLRYRSNLQKVNGGNAVTECGWDVVVADTGMYELDNAGKPRIVQVISAETGKPVNVTSPALLDGQGHAQTHAQDVVPTPYNIRFSAYNGATWPSWFYSEPPRRTIPERVSSPTT